MLNSQAAIVIIGNEILSGRTHDINSHFIAQKLFSIGIFVNEIRVIPDKKDIIVQVVGLLSEKYDYVFTTGGIGPTHDDITTDAIASIFNLELMLNTEAYEELKNYYQKNDQVLNPMREKMAYVPYSSTLIDNPISGAPGFILKNIFVLPGVPRIMQPMFINIMGKLKHGSIYSSSFKIMIAEGLIANDLAELQNNYDNVDIGSYPFEEDNKYGTTIVLNSIDKNKILAASNDLRSLFKSLNIAVQES